MLILKVIIDGESVPIHPFSSAKVIVEGLGEDGKDEIHVNCCYEGLTLDTIRDGEIDGTQHSTWEEVASQMGERDELGEHDPL